MSSEVDFTESIFLCRICRGQYPRPSIYIRVRWVIGSGTYFRLPLMLPTDEIRYKPVRSLLCTGCTYTLCGCSVRFQSGLRFEEIFAFFETTGPIDLPATAYSICETSYRTMQAETEFLKEKNCICGYSRNVITLCFL